MTVVGLRLLLLIIALAAGQASADEIRVATASNFREAMLALASAYEVNSGHEVVLISGSTGKHYAQIMNGAPFDVFFAADSDRPGLLEKNGVALPHSRFTYATGRLVLWSSQPDFIDANGGVLKNGNFRHLAVANPQLAPYGIAAMQTLQALGARDELRTRIVQGENVAQTFQFVNSGNAELGFVAWSQLQGKAGKELAGSYWLVPEELYQAIEQQAVVLKNSGAVQSFISFVRSDEAADIIKAHGYGIP